jgi:hypothetical protein
MKSYYKNRLHGRHMTQIILQHGLLAFRKGCHHTALGWLEREHQPDQSAGRVHP